MWVTDFFICDDGALCDDIIVFEMSRIVSIMLLLASITQVVVKFKKTLN